MQIIKSISVLGCFILAFSLFACQSEEEVYLSESGFQIALTDEVIGIETKSTPEQLGKPATEKFHLKITNESTHRVVYNELFKESIPASEGFYTLEASYGDNPVLAEDSPYYQGEVNAVEVTKGEKTSVEIPCKVANALTSVRFSNLAVFEELFSSYAVEVKVENKSVVLKDVVKSAYYRAGSIPTFTFKGELKNGKPVLKKLESIYFNNPETFAAGAHCILHLKVGAVSSGVNLSLQAVEVKHESISETIPLEWLPKPKVVGEGFVDNTLDVYETEAPEASIKFDIAHKLQDLKFTLNFEDEGFKGFNKEYTLSTLTDEERVSLKDLGISLPLLGEKNPSLGISSALTTRLKAKNEGDVVNEITVSEVKSNNRTTGPVTFQLLTHKPEFTINVFPENVWTKEFTIEEMTVAEGKGDFDVIKANLKYQFSADGGQTWQDCNNERKQLFESHPEQKQYKVRALYRDEIASESVDLELESPVQLPNSGMEEWSYDTYKKSYYSFYPWVSNGTPFWQTNNPYTTRHRKNDLSTNITNYNGFHAVSYIPGHNGGLAAELRSTANGRGNTKGIWLHTEKDYNKVAGELFTGAGNISMGGSDVDGSKDVFERIKDAVFVSRPTALCFWYKYVPYTSDTWSAYIELLDEDKNVIVQKEFTSSESKADWTETIVPLDYVESMSYAKCKYIYVNFKSTVNAGSNMPYREITQTFYVDGQTKTFSPAYVGSVLTIDDISLIYDK